ncbi:hypothetical protein [Mycobacterium avium]|uniref:Uncharacterized protein n=1 Tax=Mycobacterium intracellulare subsp. chimaera TaxID=222805 RepID=A0ABT7P7L0_MYCIT|nr:hypothetical protein [Mycobacterium avium]MDM3929249.1 hypothetical protein [Mycobacterium intracellulare subsp. chimaera]
MYRIVFRGGDYIDSPEMPVLSENMWAVINVEILDGGDAYQALLNTLQPDR